MKKVNLSPERVTLKKLRDNRGILIVAEAQKNIPFKIERVYCLLEMQLKPRGFHAHKNLRQVMICLSGSCKILLDNGESERTEQLSYKTYDGLLIDKMVWHEMFAFTPDCILLVLASEQYDESDYIRDYNEFLTRANNEAPAI